MEQIKENKSSFESFILSKIPVDRYKNLPEVLGVSRKKVTALLRNPRTINPFQLTVFIEQTGCSFDELKKHIIYVH